jgi:hypothetical protein
LFPDFSTNFLGFLGTWISIFLIVSRVSRSKQRFCRIVSLINWYWSWWNCVTSYRKSCASLGSSRASMSFIISVRCRLSINPGSSKI